MPARSPQHGADPLQWLGSVRAAAPPGGPFEQNWAELAAHCPLEGLDKPGLGRHRVRVRLELGPGQTVYMKLYRGRQLGLAGWEAQLLTHLRAAGVPAACPLGWGTIRREAVPTAFLATQEVPGDGLDRWLSREGAGLKASQRAGLVVLSAAMLAGMHAAGVYHRDAYLCHLFVDRAPDGTLRLAWIDLARGLLAPWRVWRWSVKDAAAMLHSSRSVGCVSDRDRLRWLAAYGRFRGWSGRRLRRWARAVVQRSGRMAVHDARRAARGLA